MRNFWLAAGRKEGSGGEPNGRRSRQGAEEGQRTVNIASAAQCCSGPGEAAMTTIRTTATELSTSKSSASLDSPNSPCCKLQEQDDLKAQSERQTLNPVGTKPADARNQASYSATNLIVATKASNRIDDCYPSGRFDAQGYIDRWDDGWDCESYLRRRRALSGYTSANLHGLWFQKEKCIAFAHRTLENAKEMVVKRQGPWPRPPPPPQNVTSSCMTCGLMMRYPNDIESFRCTVCATVNTVATLEGRAAEREAKRQELLKSKKKAAKNEDAQLPASEWLKV